MQSEMGNTKVQKQCVLCKMTVDDPVKMGEFKTYKSVSAHYYCLLLTSKLLQNGADHEGILGFLLSDIRSEERRVAKQICYYCSKPSANLACCAPKCRRTFHLYCGLENFAICHFRDDFRTICEKHHTQERKKCTKKDDCVICCESMGSYHRVLSILAPCCRSGWFHKWCIAKFALSAGYFFKCPLCNNKESFRSKLVHKGIFVPDQDAKWELEPNAFADLLVRPDSCSAENCKCPRGRSYKNYPYKLLVCSTCGSKAVHRLCMRKSSDTYSCDMCLGCLSSCPPEPLASRDSTNIVDVGAIDNEDEEIDVVGDEAPGRWEEYDGNDSVDSLLISFVRRKEPSDNGKNKSNSPNPSGDSEMTDPQRENSVSEDDINLIYRSVRKRRMSVVYDSTDESKCSIKRAKSGSPPIDSMFDEINQSFNESENNCTVRSKSCVVLRKIKLNPPEIHTISSDSDSSDKISLRHTRYDDSSSVDSFTGYEMMPTGKSSSSVCSSGRDSPAYRRIIVGNRKRMLNSVLNRDSSERFSSPDHLIRETTNTPSSGSNSDDFPDSASTVCVSNCRQHHLQIETLKGSPISSRPSRSRTRLRAKSICIDSNENPELNENVTESLDRKTRLWSKSVSVQRLENVRRSLRLQEKSKESIYKDDFVFVTEFDGDKTRRRAISHEKDILFFMENSLCDNVLSGSKFNDFVDGKLAESMTRSRSMDSPQSECCRNSTPSSVFELDSTVHANSENNGNSNIEPSAFTSEPSCHLIDNLSDFENAPLEGTLFEF